MARETITFPYMNVLAYADGLTFGVDFYDDVAPVGYAEQFETAWRQLTREAPMKPRAHPFFFVVCSGCSTPILTNRRPNAMFRCRVCATEVEAVEAASDDLRRLRDRVLDRLGKRVIDISGRLQALLVQAVEPSDLEALEAACAAAGFERAADDSPLHEWLASDGLRRGMDGSGDLSTWQKVARDGQLALQDETSPEVDDLVGTLNGIAPVRTLSVTVDLSGDDEITLLIRGEHDEVERRMRDELARDSGDVTVLAALVEVLVRRGKLEEAAEKARTLTAVRGDAESWKVLGRVLLRAEQWPEAATAFERVLELDPVDRTAMTFLAHGYEQLGDEGRAALLRAQSAALGGPY